MGIKFRCPNGHKLNVKAFLAGKKGICPHCGVSVRIPAEVENAGDDHEGETEIETGGAATAVLTKSTADTVTVASTFTVPATAVAPVATPVAQAVVVTPVVTMPTAPVISTHVAAAPVMTLPTTTPMAMAAVPMGTVAPALATPLSPSPYAIMPAAAVDPIVEAPNAVWYVRPPSGGQFGPARGEIMRKWLGEGRVSADSLVWRDGWQDWKNAALVFPALAPAGAPTAAAPLEGLTVATPVKSTSPRAPRSKKRSNGLAIGMVVGLGFLAIVLVVALLVVVFGGLGQT